MLCTKQQNATNQTVRTIRKETHPVASARSNDAFFTRLLLILPAVSCRQLDGTQADINECLKFAKAMPTITQRCQLPCQDDCQLTNWSKFSSCTADCVGVRTRKRALIGGDGAARHKQQAAV